MKADTVDGIGRCQMRVCDQRISLDKLMCAPHWRMVPKPLQRAVYDAWEALKAERCSVNREAHRNACVAAIAAVEDQRSA
jgi:hypothetical protein